MPPTDDRSAELEARNAAMRENMNSLLEGLDRQTEQLKQAQERAVAATGEATSEDGLVTARVNAACVVTGIDLSPSAFRSSTPKKLSDTIVRTIQEASLQVRSQADEAFAPIQAEIPDLPDFFPNAPSLKDLMPTAPEVPTSVDDEADEEDDDEDVEDEFFASRREGGGY